MTEDGSRTHEFSTPRRVNVKNSKKTSQSLAELSEQSGKSKTLYLIRHGNKECGDHHANLCTAGRIRADNLPKIFNGKSSHAHVTFKKPQHLVAYYYDEAKYHAQRCYDTLWPTMAKYLDSKKPYIHKVYYKKGEDRNVKGADKIRDYFKTSDVVLAAWEHEHMEKMALKLKMTGPQHDYLGHKHESTNKEYACSPAWPADTNFDYVYIFRYDNWPADDKPTSVHCHKQHITIPEEAYSKSATHVCKYDAHHGNTENC